MALSGSGAEHAQQLGNRRDPGANLLDPVLTEPAHAARHRRRGDLGARRRRRIRARISRDITDHLVDADAAGIAGALAIEASPGSKASMSSSAEGSTPLSRSSAALNVTGCFTRGRAGG